MEWTPDMAATLKRYGSLLGMVAIIVFFWMALPDTFMTARNWLNISQQLSMLTVVAVTMTVVMVMGDFEDAVYCWRSQAKTWGNYATGILLASAAGALGVKLGDPLRHRCTVKQSGEE